MQRAVKGVKWRGVPMCHWSQPGPGFALHHPAMELDLIDLRHCRACSGRHNAREGWLLHASVLEH